jgi:hypothetical protein
MMDQKLYVAGTLVIPVYFPVMSPCKEQALEQVRNTLSSRTISIVDGEISTWDGRSYPLIARRVRIGWTDVVTEMDVF